MSDSATWSQSVCEGNPGVDRRETGRGTTPLDPKDAEIERLERDKKFLSDMMREHDRQNDEMVRALRRENRRIMQEWAISEGVRTGNMPSDDGLQARLDRANAENVCVFCEMTNSEHKNAYLEVYGERESLRARLEQAERSRDEFERMWVEVVDLENDARQEIDRLRANVERLEKRTQGHRDAYHHISHLIPNEVSGAMTAEIKWIADQFAALRARETEARWIIYAKPNTPGFYDRRNEWARGYEKRNGGKEGEG